MLGSLDPGWIISLCEAILLRRIAILPTVALLLIIAKCLEDAMHGFIDDGLLGLFVDGFPWHADSPSFWGGGQQPPTSTPWACWLLLACRAILLDLGRVGHMLLSMQ